MKHEELNNLIQSMKNIRNSASDENALDAKGIYPAWKTDTAYAVNDRIRYGENLYRCVQAHTSQDSWKPDVTPALWTRIFIEEFPEWIQPTGTQDAYQTGDKVSHNGKHWISTADNNVWEPGVYGWNEVTE